MAARVLLREHPHRSVALATSSHVLIFRHSSSSRSASNSKISLHNSLAGAGISGETGGPRCIVELVKYGEADLSNYKPISLSVHGTLGLITVDGDVFLCVVSGTSRAAQRRPKETVNRILSVEFYCLNKADHDQALHDDINLYPTDSLEEDGFESGHNSGRREPVVEHPCLALKKLLSGGSFYYSVDFDLTNRVQDRSEDASTTDFDSFDKGYLWNSYMIRPLIDFRSRLSGLEKSELDSTQLLTLAIRGFALTITVPAASSPARASRTGLPSSLTLISRLSCKRAGTRFNARGVDDDGNVANFVETETVFWSPTGICFSYVQIRGSIPLFWEQAPGLLPTQQKIQITRSPQATQPAFDKHFEELEMKYSTVHVVNLLSNEKLGEVELSQRYREHVARSSLNSRRDGDKPSEHRFLRETDYDFHAETRGPGGYEAASRITRYIEDSVESFGYCLVEDADDQMGSGFLGENLSQSSMILQQQGVFRTNCLDCLDRTNLVQTIISKMTFEAFLEHRAERMNGDLAARHGTLWADNGDALSRIYAGTGALKSSFTRSGKMSLAGALADARKSATRMYINNFADKGRQNTMDLLLGRLMGQTPVYLFDPINDYVMSELERRASEYTSKRDIRIWTGTMNLNGRGDGLTADLSPWLCPLTEKPQVEAQIVAVGFQEIVELSPQHIMSTEPTQRQAWEKAVKRTLNSRARQNGLEEYVLLRGGQLVGASLSIFVKVGLLSHVKNVDASLKKTGMSGMAGNKGAVAIRMDIDSTSLCFVTAHLAAGFANYEERNRDYKTISHGLRFQRNRSIEDHNSVIWLGDFNYRIGLSTEKVRSFVATDDLESLYENDQLNLQMVAGNTFPHYSEARIFFPPTYKFDLGTDQYDSSEKARIPAWCDRILCKGHNLRQTTYTSASSLKFSDHRPVYAGFVCAINVVDEIHKARLRKELYDQRRSFIGGLDSNGGSEDDGDLIGYESVEPGLPPASSDRRKWWLDNGLPARSKIQPPGKDVIPSPDRPANPFAATAIPDWAVRARQGDSSRDAPGSSSISRKPVPPTVPKKPMSLSSSSPPNRQARTLGPDNVSGPLSHRPATSAPPNMAEIVDIPPPPPPRRTKAGTASQLSKGPKESTYPSKSKTRKPLARNPSSLLDVDDNSSQTSRSSQGLMDDDDEDKGQAQGLSSWVPLKPS